MPALAGSRPVVTIRTESTAIPLKARADAASRLEYFARKWGYILRSRTRWASHRDLRHAFRSRAIADLAQLGVSRASIQTLASVPHVEVELHAWDAEDPISNRIHEAAAETPWEYLISAATRGEGRFEPIVITRLYRNGSRSVSTSRPKHLLFVESAPGRLEDLYGFESERERIHAAVCGDCGCSMQISETATTSDLSKTVRSRPWDIVHVTGVDTHQAAQYLTGLYETLSQRPAAWKRIADESGRIRDGMILRRANIAELPLRYEDLACLLVDPIHPPGLVTLNLYHSAARTAREIVRRGARVALGFLDEIDDEVAERFFQAFLWEWCHRPPGAAVASSFAEAWKKMKGDGLHGTAIVMWTGRSVFDGHGATRGIEADTPREEGAGSPRTREPQLSQMPIDKLLQVEVEVDNEVNYSLLHNDRALLRKLTLTSLRNEPLEDITVQVELNLGSQNYPYRCTQLVLTEHQLALAPLVRIPLTATLPRSLRERVQSTVYVKVTLKGRTAHESTRRVTLIPVDEWLDDTETNPWLPSFVLPRDPAILKIVDSARRYMVGIRDDPAAGFDGYQSVDEAAAEPTACLDAQVRAIWTALVSEFHLQYINPPPTYSARTQRLRTPSDVLGSKTGTCIDLALLLASCLEYVGIYPVIVLLRGHAFVGYWRSEDAHGEFSGMLRIPADVPTVGSKVALAAAVPFVDRYGWRLTKMQYNEIMAYVIKGDLVMLEATLLTASSSFGDAVREGRANMRSRREFESLLDIQLARTATPPVTPLPILNE